jgi:hypothetical protein
MLLTQLLSYPQKSNCKPSEQEPLQAIQVIHAFIQKLPVQHTTYDLFLQIWDTGIQLVVETAGQDLCKTVYDRIQEKDEQNRGAAWLSIHTRSKHGTQSKATYTQLQAIPEEDEGDASPLIIPTPIEDPVSTNQEDNTESNIEPTDFQEARDIGSETEEETDTDSESLTRTYLSSDIESLASDSEDDFEDLSYE